jgi:hypothetical protein
MPEITAAPNPLDWGQPVDGLGVLSEQGKWAARAADARKAAESLKNAVEIVEPLIKGNYFGQDCEEGAALRDSLLALVGAEGSWRNELVNQIVRLEQLADQCENAAKELAATDQDSAAELSRDQ